MSKKKKIFKGYYTYMNIQKVIKSLLHYSNK